MIRLILMLSLAVSLPLAAPENIVAQTAEDTAASLEQCRAATVRVKSGGTVGTGTFFLEKEDTYCVLTNSHVAGRTGNRVYVEMWYQGYLSQPVPGRVVYSVRKRQYYRDIAVIEVKKSDLRGYEPPVVPIASSDYEPDYSRIYSFGCGAGSWLTNWEGHSFRRESNSGDVINFYPQPAGGRSGSAIFSSDGQYIIGLIAWRSMSGQHSKDGSHENPRYHGIAMTKDEIREAFSGKAPTSYVPVNPEPLPLPSYEEADRAPASATVPSIFYQDDETDCRTAQEHGAQSVLEGRTLTYQDSLTPLEPVTRQELFPNLMRRREGPRMQPGPPEPHDFQDNGPRLFNLPDGPRKPQEPQMDPDRPLLPNLPEKLKERQEERQEQREDRQEKFVAPEPEQKEQTPEDKPKQEEQAPQEEAEPWFTWRDVLDIVLIAAAVTGVWVWLRGPIMAGVTSLAVRAAPETVRSKLDKRDS